MNETDDQKINEAYRKIINGKKTYKGLNEENGKQDIKKIKDNIKKLATTLIDLESDIGKKDDAFIKELMKGYTFKESLEDLSNKIQKWYFTVKKI